MKQKSQKIQAILEVFNNKYTNPQYIGQGSFAHVFKCQTENQEYVAIKVVDLQKIEQEAIPYMKNEIEILQKSQNNNVIQLIEAFQTDERLFLVLEYCIIDVNQMMKKYYKMGLPEDLVIVILRQLVNGLHDLHKNKIIHRDIKLENIGVKLSIEDEDKLINQNDQSVFKNASYKILDFGFAKQLLTDDLTNTYAGTELHMAPEIILMEPYSISADIFSLGICIFQLITGKVPFNQQTGALDKIKNEIAEFHLIQNETLRQMVQKMLKYDPKERLTWTELYQYLFFQNKKGQVQSILDLQLQNNLEMYTSYKYDKIEKNEQDLLNQSGQINQKFFLSESNDQFKASYKCDKIMNKQQVAKIKFWNILRNSCILLSKLTNNLILLLNSIDYLANELYYYSFHSEFNSYINYLCNLNEQIYNYMKQDMNNLISEYCTFQDYIILRNSLEQDEELKNIQNNRQTQNTFFSHIILFARQQLRLLQKLDLQQFQFGTQDFQKQTDQNNILIFKQTLQIMYDSNFKLVEANSKQLKLIQCQIYRILIDLARVRAMLSGNWNGGDDKINEIRLGNFESQPDQLSEFLTEILDIYKLKYYE